MKQFLLPASYADQPVIMLKGEDFHYLSRVRRVEKHQVFPGIDTHGTPYELEVLEITSEALSIKVKKLKEKPDDGVRITLFQCIPKGKGMDTIIRQCVETGVFRIIPIISDHTIIKLTDEKRSARVKRWEKIAKEAVQQSGSTLPLTIAPITVLRDTPVFFNDFDLKLFFHEQPLANKGLHQYLFEERKHLALIIGPEGGLSRKEVGFLQDSGFVPVWLGNRILRVDTAALSAISSIQTLLLEKEVWKSR